MHTTPDDDGIPTVADDDSTAYDTHDSHNPRRYEDSPPALPTDQPFGIDEYGMTPYESAHREPLGPKLSRELPDIDSTRSPSQRPPVGRLVAPNGGDFSHDDHEDEEIAWDSGEEDGLSAEEAALHPVRSQDVPFRQGDSYLDD